MTLNFDKRLFICLVLAFILFTVIGTLTHELGHYFMAKSLGYDATINYGATYWQSSGPKQIIGKHDYLIIISAGPLETMLTGTIGLILIFSYRKKIQTAKQLSFGQWTLIFIALFWLRQAFNFISSVVIYFFHGEFPQRSDEVSIAKELHLPYWSISLLTAIIGTIVLTIITFKFIPLRQRFTFIIGGLAGGLIGFFLWLGWLGKIIMP